jgi:hypothetical protein
MRLGHVRKGRGGLPRYYFDFREDGGMVPDEEGTEIDGLGAARDEAARTLAEMARSVLPGSTCRRLTIEVRGESGGPLLRTTLAFEVELLSPLPK